MENSTNNTYLKDELDLFFEDLINNNSDIKQSINNTNWIDMIKSELKIKFSNLTINNSLSSTKNKNKGKENCKYNGRNNNGNEMNENKFKDNNNIDNNEGEAEEKEDKKNEEKKSGGKAKYRKRNTNVNSIETKIGKENVDGNKINNNSF